MLEYFVMNLKCVTGKLYNSTAVEKHREKKTFSVALHRGFSGFVFESSASPRLLKSSPERTPRDKTIFIRVCSEVVGHSVNNKHDFRQIKCPAFVTALTKQWSNVKEYWPPDVALAQVFMRRGLFNEELHLCWHIQRLIVREVSTCRGTNSHHNAPASTENSAWWK